MDVLVMGADTVVGRTVADAFSSAGHRVVTAGADVGDLGDEAVVCDCTDPVDLARAQSRFPHHLDAVVVVPAEGFAGPDPRTATLADTAQAWSSTLDRTVLAAVLTVQTVSEHLRSGGSVVAVLPACGTAAEAAAKAALSEWTAAQADHFGTRGITINTVAAGLPAHPGYQGLTGEPPSAPAEIARLAMFLSTPAARHITGHTLHVRRGAALTYS